MMGDVEDCKLVGAVTLIEPTHMDGTSAQISCRIHLKRRDITTR